MKLNTSKINESCPILVLYSSGTGGEFLTKTIAENTSNIVKGNFISNNQRNQTHFETLLDYSSNWSDLEDPNTWIKNIDLIGDNDSDRYIFRDHPNLFFAKYYWKYFPNITVIHFTVKKEYEYFSRLTFKKLSKKIKTTEIDRDFILSIVNNKCQSKNIRKIIQWASDYEWIWQHDLLNVNTMLAKNQNILNYKHSDNIDVYVEKQANAIAYESNDLSFYLSQIFDNYNTVEIDSLIKDSTSFCSNINKIIPLLNPVPTTKKINKWIENNNSLINGNSND